MAITFFDTGAYARYQVRVCRHGTRYTKTFNCAIGKKKALQAAKEYEQRLLETLDTPPMTNAGRSKVNFKKGPTFQPFLETNAKYGTQYVAVSYRREDGCWKRVSYSVAIHGKAKATKLAIAEAKRRHVPNDNLVKKKRMPSLTKVKTVLGDE